MATNSKVFVSPGVYTSERDLSFVTQSVGVTTLGVVGEALKGPAFEPIFISSYDEFQTYFGGTNPEKFINTQIPKYESAYIAKSYLQQSNQMFMTRVLGLSGYDAGPSWSIQTIANVDPTTIKMDEVCASVPNYNDNTCDITCTGVSLSFDVEFTGCSNQDGSITYVTNFPDEIQNIINNQYTKFNGGVSTLKSDINQQLLSIFAQPSLSGTSINYWGSIDNIDYDILSPVFTDANNVLNVPSVNESDTDFSSPFNDSWYYSLFDNFSGDSYSGMSFWTVVSELTMLPKTGTTTTTTTTMNITTTTTTLNPCATTTTTSPITTTTTTQPDCFTGTLHGKIYYYTGTSYSNYNNLIVSTLRSRGLTTYDTTNDGPTYEVSALSAVTLDFTGSYSAVKKNPFAPFAINVTNDEGKTFVFKTSLQESDATYLPKVFGGSNFAKPRTEVPLFVEETFSSMLNWAFKKGYIRGLRAELISTPESRSNNSSSIGFYGERYQTPESPWLVSELRGTKVYRLFKFISIADGNSANDQLKISIMNMSFGNQTFDVVIRDWYDTDDAPVVLEKFTNCSMDPNLNNFVAKKIGTADGEYALNSKFVMVEINEDAPTDSLPCGFEGYTFRNYESVKSPFPVYKTKYDFPGEVIFNPPFGYSNGQDNPAISAGDNVRRTYLGLSNAAGAGYDLDFFQYVGKQNLGTTCDPVLQDWSYLTKGFHMDSGATVVKIADLFATSGRTAFAVGDAEFRNDPTNANNPYYRLYARKFSLMVNGGFDGWDVYREYRTNSDRFQVGSSGYLAGACYSDRYPNATGTGLFKRITVGDNTQDWANTDYYAYLLGQKTFSNPEAVNINVFVTPGIDYVNNSNLVEQAIEMIEYDRADSLYICTTPDFNMFVPSTTDSLDMIFPQEAVDNLEQTGIDSNYTATYYPWVLTRDTVNNTQIYIPATAEVTRNLALTDNIAFPWFASAGYTRGLVNSIKARRKLTQEDRDTLYVGRLNPIATFSDVGTVIWGNKTLQIRESALDRINVRRLLLQARKLISAVAVRLLFEQNDAKVRQDFLDAVNPILDAIRRDRGLYDFRVTVSSSPEDLDKNQLVGKIYIKPTKALEFIDIEFLITPTGASFDNI
jgi:hypothetical protein